jgi:hypothetical protein
MLLVQTSIPGQEKRSPTSIRLKHFRRSQGAFVAIVDRTNDVPTRYTTLRNKRGFKSFEVIYLVTL